MLSETDQLLNFAVSLVATAERFSLSDLGRAEVFRKPDGSDATSSDLRIQRALCERIGDRFPEHAVVCEEAGDYLTRFPPPWSARYCWVIDPIDGTRNYVRGLPCFCTSIGLLDEGTPVIGVIGYPLIGATYTAVRGEGANVHGRRMRVAQPPVGRRPMVTFQPGSSDDTYDLAASWLRRIHLRSLGVTALHLALLADGAIDASLCVENHVWDIAAGGLMVTESGGVLTDLRGQPIFPFDLRDDVGRKTPFLAGIPEVHQVLLAGLQPT